MGRLEFESIFDLSVLISIISTRLARIFHEASKACSRKGDNKQL